MALYNRLSRVEIRLMKVNKSQLRVTDLFPVLFPYPLFPSHILVFLSPIRAFRFQGAKQPLVFLVQASDLQHQKTIAVNFIDSAGLINAALKAALIPFISTEKC